MSEFSIIGEEDGGYNVWIQLEEGDPTGQGESFIIGQGDIKAEAISVAIRALEIDIMTLVRLYECEKVKR